MLLLAQDVEQGIGQSSLDRDAGLILQSITRAPQSRVRPGGTLVVRASVVNLGTQEAAGVIVASLAGFPGEQSARLVSVQPGSQEQAEVAISLPVSIADLTKIQVDVSLNADYGNREVMLDRDGMPMQDRLTLAVNPWPTMAALALEQEPLDWPFWYWPYQVPSSAYELLVATRIESGNSRHTVSFDGGSLPLSVTDWEVVDLLVISEQKVFEDAAAVESAKRHLADGGRIWVMLDRVDSESLRELLGNEQACETVDTIELNEFSIDLIGGHVPVSAADREVSSERPLVMKRVVQSGGRVTHAIDGWPAAIWMQVGYGELLLTTLDSAAWIQPRTSQRSKDPGYQSRYKPKIWANQLAAEANLARAKKPLSETVDYPLKHIGNPVVPRSWVAMVLVGFCLALAATGLWRLIAGELSWLGVLAPAISVLAGGGLLIASTWVRQDIPESVSRLQVIDVAEDGTFGLASEQSAVYLESSTSMRLVSQADGRARVDPTMDTGIRRLTAEDFQQWNLANQSWPPGTWRVWSEYALATDELTVSARLSEQGVRLRLPDGLPSPMEDVVVGFAVGDPMLCRVSGSELLADGSLAASGERWINGSIITDEQQRRLEIYQEFFRPNELSTLRDRVLYGWTGLWPGGPQWDRELLQFGSALVGLPIRLERPQTGENLFIPHGLIRLRRDPSLVAQTVAYNDTTGKWVTDLTRATQANLQFVLPPETVPFEAESLQFDLDIKAPHRVVRVLSRSQDEPIEIVRLDGPSIPWNGTVTDPRILQDARDGVVDILLEVGERTDVQDQANPANVVAWQVNYFHANLRGKTAAGSSLNNQ